MAKLTKVAIASDLHCRLINPYSRKDDYFLASMQKLDFILKSCDYLIQLGDWFDKARTEDVVKNTILDLINKHGSEVYVVPGNHDIDKDLMETLPKTSLGNLIKHKAVTLLTPDKVWNIGGLSIGVLDYDIVNAKTQHFDGIDILVGHHFYNWERDLSQSLVQEDIPKYNAEYIFLGHDHEPHKDEIVGRTRIIRTGSVLRKELKNYTETHEPCFYLFSIDEKGILAKVEKILLPCTSFEDAFFYKEKQSFKRCTKLIADIKDFIKTINIQDSSKRTIGTILQEDLKAPKEVYDYLKLVYRVNHVEF